MADVDRPDRLDETAIAARRRQVAGLYLRRVTQADIARQLEVSQGTVSGDLTALRDRWRQESLTDTEAAILRELAELDQMEQDTALQFHATKGVEWIIARLRIKERRARLLGLDRPVKADVTFVQKAYVDYPADDPEA